MIYKNHTIDLIDGRYRLRPQWSVSAARELWFTTEDAARDWVDDEDAGWDDPTQGELL